MHSASEAADTDSIRRADQTSSSQDATDSRNREVSNTHALPTGAIHEPVPAPAASTASRGRRSSPGRRHSVPIAIGLVVVGLTFGIGSIAIALGLPSEESESPMAAHAAEDRASPVEEPEAAPPVEPP